MHRPNRFTLWNIYQELLRNFTFRGERPDHMVQYWNWAPFQQQARRGAPASKGKKVYFLHTKTDTKVKINTKVSWFFPFNISWKSIKKKVLFSYVIRSGQYKNHILRNKPVTGSMKMNYVPTYTWLFVDLTYMFLPHICYYCIPARPVALTSLLRQISEQMTSFHDRDTN